MLWNSGTIVRNSVGKHQLLAATSKSTVVRYAAASQKRLYATETTQPAKKFSKWSILKNGIKIGLVGGISYGCYGNIKVLKQVFIWWY